MNKSKKTKKTLYRVKYRVKGQLGETYTYAYSPLQARRFVEHRLPQGARITAVVND
jgi:hypothetical protein